MSDNPFEILGLPASATEEDAVKAAARLSARAGDEAARNRIRQAVSTLTASREARLLWSALTPPTAAADRTATDAFVREHRKAPQPTADVVADHRAEVEAFRELLRQEILRELQGPPSEIEMLQCGETPAEISRQSDEAAWLAKLVEMGG